MTESFTRDSLAAYEKGPQKTVSDTANPFRGATPAQAASPAAVSAVAAGNVDATPGGAPRSNATATPDPLVDDSPVVDEDGTLGDPTESGEGTSDENTEDASASAVDPSDETDPNADLTGDEPTEEVDSRPAPKKGSAAERIVEVLDLAEGYKEYGKLKESQVQELQAEVIRLRGGAPTPAAAPRAAVVASAIEPFPDMADEDVAFDNDKYKAKVAHYVAKTAQAMARAEMQRASGEDAAARNLQNIGQKIETYAKTHTDFEKVVIKNPVLLNNPLGPDAGATISESEHTAELLYRFGKDPSLAVRTAKMNPRQQVAQVTNMIRDIEDELHPAGKKPATQGGAKSASKSITKAPPPPRVTTGGGSATARAPTDPNLSMDEFARQHRTGKQSARESARTGRGLR